MLYKFLTALAIVAASQVGNAPPLDLPETLARAAGAPSSARSALTATTHALPQAAPLQATEDAPANEVLAVLKRIDAKLVRSEHRAPSSRTPFRRLTPSV